MSAITVPDDQYLGARSNAFAPAPQVRHGKERIPDIWIAAGGDNAFYEVKLATGRFFAARALPQTTSLTHHQGLQRHVNGSSGGRVLESV